MNELVSIPAWIVEAHAESMNSTSLMLANDLHQDDTVCKHPRMFYSVGYTTIDCVQNASCPDCGDRVDLKSAGDCCETVPLGCNKYDSLLERVTDGPIDGNDDGSEDDILATAEAESPIQHLAVDCASDKFEKTLFFPAVHMEPALK